MDSTEFKIYICQLCGFVYDEKLGLPGDGIQAGTRWEDIPDDWICPNCGAAKSNYRMLAQ